MNRLTLEKIFAFRSSCRGVRNLAFNQEKRRKEAKPKETRTEYLIGAPERPDRDETIYSTADADDANETLREILAALAAADATPALWKDGRKTDAENFCFD